MQTVSIVLDEHMRSRLVEIAGENGTSLENCISLALSEYVANYDDCRGEDLCMVSGTERSFFLSAGE